MSRTLLWQELRALSSFVAGALLLALLGPLLATDLLSLLGESPSGAPGGYVLGRGIERPAWDDLLALGSWAFALALLRAAWSREREAFMERLPLQRRRALAARGGACLGVILAVPLVRHGVYGGAHLLYGDWQAGLALGVVAPLLLADLVRGVVMFGVALGLSRCGARAGWVLGAGVVISRAAATHGFAPGYLDVLRPAMRGAGAVGLDGAGVLLWLALAAFAAGYGLRRGSPQPAGVTPPLERGVLGHLSRGVALVVAVMLPLTVLSAEVRPGPRAATYPGGMVTARTKGHVFRYESRRTTRARPLIDAADDLLAAVRARLGEERAPEDPIALRLVLGSDPAEGEVGLGSAEGARFALARITADRLADRASGGRLAGWSQALGVLREGIARYIGCQASGLDPFESRFMAAVIHTRRPVLLEELFDRADLTRVRGAESVAVLGEVLALAIEREGGPAALRRLLEAIAGLSKRSAPSSSNACRALWRELLSACALDSSKLELRLLEALEDGVRADPRAAVPLPRLHAALQLQESPIGWRIIAIPDQDLPRGWFVVCRLRRPDGTLERPQRLGPEANGCATFFTHSNPFAGTPQVQLGLRRVGDRPLTRSLWEDWQAPNGRP